MIEPRFIERSAFDVVGKKTWISGQDNDLFASFWAAARTDGLLAQLNALNSQCPGPQPQGIVLGISQVERDPARRAFYYWIAVEKPVGIDFPDLDTYRVPAACWAVFDCWGEIPQAIVTSEIYAFTNWLPASGYMHAPAPEMEVYLPVSSASGERPGCEFWLPIIHK